MKSGSQTLVINTEPNNATVYLNGNEVGATPYAYEYNREHGSDLAFEVRKNGYTSSTVNVRTKRNNGLLFVDAMLLHIPYIVDHKSKALISMPRSEVNINMFKEVAEDVTTQMVPVTTVNVKIDFSTSLGKVNSAKVTRTLDKDRIFQDLKYNDQLANYVVNGMRGTWMDAHTVRIGTTKGDEAIRKAKVYLEPEITNIDTDLSRKGRLMDGPFAMDVEWKFYNGAKKDSVIMTRSTHTTYNAYGVRGVDLLGEALGQAARLLSEDTTLIGAVTANYGTAIIATKGDEIVLVKPDPIPFEARRDMLAALVKAVVTIKTENGHGSGFLVTNDGYLLTNQHVVEDETTVQVKFEQGFTLDGEVIKVNKDFDLALVKVSATDLPALSIGDDKNLMLGEEIFAIGTPLDATLGQSVSRGVLSGQRAIEGRNYLQTDVTINPGNSGGPFLDENGKVVGIATMKICGKGLEGLGFGVPISEVMEMLNLVIPK